MYGLIRNKMKCYYCCREKYSFQTFSLVNFILKKVINDKAKLMGNTFCDRINIYDAFENYIKEERLLREKIYIVIIANV